MSSPPTVAVHKFSSCDGCQLTLLDCEDELLAVADALDIAYFLEATSSTRPGPYDLSIVEGSITTEHDIERIHRIRDESAALITIGACATAGGIQALRNYADVDEYISTVYAHPEFIDTLATSTPIADHVPVDFELRGCPISKEQLLHVISALLAGNVPRLPSSPVCLDCKRNGNPCLMVTEQIPCLGPITHTGCAALCPGHGRGCFGCFGPADSGNLPALEAQFHELGVSDRKIQNLLSTFTVSQFQALQAELETAAEETS